MHLNVPAGADKCQISLILNLEGKLYNRAMYMHCCGHGHDAVSDIGCFLFYLKKKEVGSNVDSGVARVKPSISLTFIF